jgi:hypothetical protein
MSSPDRHPFSHYKKQTEGHLQVDPTTARIGLDIIELFTQLFGFDPTLLVRKIAIILSENDTTLAEHSSETNEITVRVFARHFFYATSSVRSASDSFIPKTAKILRKEPNKVSEKDRLYLQKYQKIFDQINASTEKINKTGFVSSLFHEILHSMVDSAVTTPARESMGLPADILSSILNKQEKFHRKKTIRNTTKILGQQFIELANAKAEYTQFQGINREIIALFFGDPALSTNEKAFLLLRAYLVGVEELGHRLCQIIIHHWLESSNTERLTQDLILDNSPTTRELGTGYGFNTGCLLPDAELVAAVTKYESCFETKNTRALLNVLEGNARGLMTQDAFQTSQVEAFRDFFPDIDELVSLIPWQVVTEGWYLFITDLVTYLSTFVEQRELSEKLRLNKVLMYLDSWYEPRYEFSWFDWTRYEKRAQPESYHDLVEMNDELCRAVISATAEHINKYGGQELTDEELNNYLYHAYVSGLTELLWHAAMKLSYLRHRETDVSTHGDYFAKLGEFVDSPDIQKKHARGYHLVPAERLAHRLKETTSEEEVRSFIFDQLLPAFSDPKQYQERAKDIVGDRVGVFTAQTSFVKDARKLYRDFVGEINNLLER